MERNIHAFPPGTGLQKNFDDRDNFPSFINNCLLIYQRMETQPPPLAAQLAGLRAATTSNDDRTMLPAALHALIAAIFARLFDRLEQILLLWQSGQLPLTNRHFEQSALTNRHPESL